MEEILGPQHVAGGTLAGYTFSPQTYMTYTWTAVGGVIIFGQNLAACLVQWNQAGHYTLQVQFTGTEGALDSIFIPVDVDANGGNPNRGDN